MKNLIFGFISDSGKWNHISVRPEDKNAMVALLGLIKGSLKPEHVPILLEFENNQIDSPTIIFSVKDLDC